MRILLSILVISLSLDCCAQVSADSVWYILARNRVIEFTVTSDSMISRQLDWDLTPRINSRNYRSANPIDSLIRRGGGLYMVRHQDVSNSSKKIIGYWIPSMNYKGLFVSKSDTVKSYDLSQIDKNVKSDSLESLFPLYIPKGELDRIRLLPGVDKMDSIGFQKYIAAIMQMRSKMKRMELENRSPTEVLYFGYFMSRYTFALVGYNPLVSESEYELWYKKFSSRPDSKALLDELIEK